MGTWGQVLSCVDDPVSLLLLSTNPAHNAESSTASRLEDLFLSSLASLVLDVLAKRNHNGNKIRNDSNNINTNNNKKKKTINVITTVRMQKGT